MLRLAPLLLIAAPLLIHLLAAPLLLLLLLLAAQLLLAPTLLFRSRSRGGECLGQGILQFRACFSNMLFKLRLPLGSKPLRLRLLLQASCLGLVRFCFGTRLLCFWLSPPERRAPPVRPPWPWPALAPLPHTSSGLEADL